MRPRASLSSHDTAARAVVAYLSGTAVTDKDELEGGGLGLSVRHICWWGGVERVDG